MAARWIAAVMAAVMFLIVGFFVVVAVRGPAGGMVPRDSSSASNFPSDSTTTHQIGRFTVTVFTSSRPGEAEIALSVRYKSGDPGVPQSVPSAVLQMSGMESAPVELQRTSSGLWRGLVRPSMSARWLFVVTVEGEQISVPIEVP